MTMKIKDTTPKQLKLVILAELQKAYKVAGYNATDNYAEMVNLLHENLTKFFPNNELSDIPTVFEKGALGDYGEYAGISVRTIYSWMRTFNGNAVNRTADMEPEQPKADEAPRDHVQDGRDLVNSCYATYLDKGCFFAPSSMICKILLDNGIDLSGKMDYAKKKAEENLEEEFKRNRADYRFKKLGDFISGNLETEATGVLIKGYFAECKRKGMKNIF